MKFLAAACIVCVFAGTAQAQTIFKCRDAKGQLSYQHQPCDGNLRGAVEVKPANVVEGKPEGERQSRSEAAKRQRVRSAIAHGKVVPGMTEDEVVEAVRRRQGPGLQPCYTPQQIRNAEVGSDSFKMTAAEKRAKQWEIERMRNCVR